MMFSLTVSDPLEFVKPKAWVFSPHPKLVVGHRALFPAHDCELPLSVLPKGLFL
jgi:hypothetical protein